MVTKEKIFAADEFISDFESSYTQVKRAIERSQERHKKEADKHRRNLDLKVGQYVLLRFEKARLKKRQEKKESCETFHPLLWTISDHGTRQ